MHHVLFLFSVRKCTNNYHDDDVGLRAFYSFYKHTNSFRGKFGFENSVREHLKWLVACINETANFTLHTSIVQTLFRNHAKARAMKKKKTAYCGAISYCHCALNKLRKCPNLIHSCFMHIAARYLILRFFFQSSRGKLIDQRARKIKVNEVFPRVVSIWTEVNSIMISYHYYTNLQSYKCYQLEALYALYWFDVFLCNIRSSPHCTNLGLLFGVNRFGLDDCVESADALNTFIFSAQAGFKTVHCIIYICTCSRVCVVMMKLIKTINNNSMSMHRINKRLFNSTNRSWKMRWRGEMRCGGATSEKMHNRIFHFVYW